jgi:hypothetical protein
MASPNRESAWIIPDRKAEGVNRTRIILLGSPANGPQDNIRFVESISEVVSMKAMGKLIESVGF